MEMHPNGSSSRDLRQVGIHPNFWYPVARSADVKLGKLFAAHFAGEPIVIARPRDGAVFALEDRCAHRQMPLHLGVLEGERLKCGYHGWCYGAGGRLDQIPYLTEGGKIPPEARRVRSYPCREQYGLIFIFGGSASMAEKVPLPELPEFHSSDYSTMYFSREVGCHYTFMHENLMDMNHQFLHRRLMGGIQPVLLSHRAGDDWVEAAYKFEGGKQHPGADMLVMGGKGEWQTDRDYELMTIRTDYPYQNLIVYRSHSTTPTVRLWAAYVPIDDEQRRNRSFGLLMIRRPSIPGLLTLAWPLIRYFAQSVFRQDRLAVEAEQQAYDTQGADWNHEVSPVLLELRRVLGDCGVSRRNTQLLSPEPLRRVAHARK
jgi:renierapurpurin 18,18'-hydroxylase